ncbi:MAG TPA: cation diffusion facilitator family transporter [Acidimicrobiales bacterium]|nr:cation diffusion facilitator family transporter [Acidimicrobiales bacterium]
MSHDHGHAPHGDSDGRYVLAALAVIVAFMVGEVVAAVLGGSIALLADAGHMLTDAGALGMSYWAGRLAGRPARGWMTFGLKRAEILSAAANGLTLAVVAAALVVGAIDRLVHPVQVHGLTMTVVAAIGVVDNLIATAILARAERQSLNIAGALAHLVTDIWAFAGTLAAGIVILTTGFKRADPIASLVVVVLMVRAAWFLLKASGRVLLEGAPEHVDLEDLRSHILEVEEVTAVHDLHVWVVTSDLPAVAAHVVVVDRCFADGTAPQVLDRLQECLAGHFDVAHSTFQLEPASHAAHEEYQHD